MDSQRSHTVVINRDVVTQWRTPNLPLKSSHSDVLLSIEGLVIICLNILISSEF